MTPCTSMSATMVAFEAGSVGTLPCMMVVGSSAMTWQLVERRATTS